MVMVIEQVGLGCSKKKVSMQPWMITWMRIKRGTDAQVLEGEK